jgi:hypothetical protein
MDHLAEDPDYYEKLAKVHLEGFERVGPPRALRYGSAALAAVSFVRNDWPMNLMAYLLFGLSFLPRER